MASTVAEPVKIALLDDEELFLRSVAYVEPLASAEAFENSVEFLNWAHEHPDAVFVSDLKMHGDSDGVTVLEDVRRLSPNATLILLTGGKLTTSDSSRLHAVGAYAVSKSNNFFQQIADIIQEKTDAHPLYKLEREDFEQVHLELLLQYEKAMKYLRMFTGDLVEELDSVPNKHQVEFFGNEGYTVSDLIHDVNELSPRGEEYINLWRKYQQEVRSRRRER